jgi:hypothetical protein
MAANLKSTSEPIGFGPGGPNPTTTPWISYGSWIDYDGGVVIGNPAGGNMGPGTINAQAFFTNGTQYDLASYLPLTGGIISGGLTVNGAFVIKSTCDGITLDMGTY